MATATTGIEPAIHEHYWTRGWVVVEGVFDAATCDEMFKLALEVSSRELADTNNRYVADRGEDGTVAPRKIDGPFLKEQRFREFVLSPKLEQLVTGLLGKPGKITRDQIFLKPPRFGSAKPYHQDNAYFHCEPADSVLTAWIALDDVDEANGCLRYIDGSHREGILPHTPVPGETHNMAPKPELIDLSRESLAIVKKGGVVFHHGTTLHTSHRNTSDRWRPAYATHWLTEETTSTSKVAADAYFRQPQWAHLFK